MTWKTVTASLSNRMADPSYTPWILGRQFKLFHTPLCIILSSECSS